MIKLLSRSIIALTLILGFAPDVKPITVSENDNFYVQEITNDEEKLATANKLLQEGYELFKQSTKESRLQAIEKWQQALPLFQALEDKKIEATVQLGIAAIYNSLGEKEKALTYYNHALPLLRAIKNRNSEATTLMNLGSIYNYLGKKQKALDYLNQALPIFRELEDGNGEAIVLHSLASVYGDLGKKKKARNYYNQALFIRRAIKDRRGEATTLNNLGKLYNSLGEREKAIDYYNQALLLLRAISYQDKEGITLNNLGSVYSSLGEKETALDYFNQALSIFQKLSNRNGEATTLNNLGLLYHSLGEKEEAQNYYEQALSIYREIKDPLGEADALNNLGSIYDLSGEKEQALKYYNQALIIDRAIKNRAGEATILNNIGGIYDSLGAYEQALDYNKQALGIRRAIEDRPGEAVSLNNIASVYDSLGEKEQALDYYNQALLLRRKIGDLTGEGATLNNIGLLYDLSGEKERALNYFNQALSIFREIGNRQEEAVTLNNLGGLYDSLEQREKALEYYNQALPLRQKVGDRGGEATTHSNIALVNYYEQNYDTALQNIQDAIAIVEQIRSNIISDDLKTTYFGKIAGYYKLKSAILMELHQQNPNKGYDVLAFETSEQGKARSLLELLTEANIDIRQGITPQLLDQEQKLQLKLNAVEKRRISLCSQDCKPRLFEKLKTERRELLEQYKQVKAKIRANSPEYAELTQPEPIKLKQLQRLLDEDTVLWQYSLWRDHSYVWVITKDSFSTHKIASNPEIEPVAREYFKLLQYDSIEKKLNSVGTKLSQLITPPITETKQKSRIVIVSDGVLQYIPFATLPLENNQSLLTNHQIINLPSSSVLARLRANQNRNRVNKKQLAIFADPVFSSNDPRLPQKQAPGTEDLGGNDLHIQSFDKSTLVKNNPKSTLSKVTSPGEFTYDPLRSAIRSSDLQLSRLRGTEIEAKDILDLVSEYQQSSVFGFDANLEFATSPELSNYNIVHFATHGILNSEQPELSGIVLSLFDNQGKPQNGFLRLHEVFNLNLPADLVVLSACQTGLGKEIKGEGLVGLTRGFMYAGATRVLVSLWSVDDRATAEFMSKFYGFMLQDKLSPASALNATQRYMQNHGKWSHPYYWAAFTLQGDWLKN